MTSQDGVGWWHDMVRQCRRMGKSMALDNQQARVIAINADVLLNLGAARVILTRCGQCNTPAIAEYPGALIVCGYCGQDTELARYDMVPLWRRVLDKLR